MEPTVHPEPFDRLDPSEGAASATWSYGPDGTVRPLWAIVLYVLLGAIGFGLEMFCAWALFGRAIGNLQMGDGLGVIVLIARVAWVCSATWLSCRAVGWRFGDANIRDTRWLQHAGLGAAMGVAALSLSVAVPWAAGHEHFSVTGASLEHLAAPFLWAIASCAAIALSEELMVRGFGFGQLRRWVGSRATVVLSAVVFGSLHTLNPNVTWIGLANIVLVGVWFGLALERTGSLWMPIGMHFAWNLTQATLWGEPVSGFPTRVSILVRGPPGDALWTGGTFGPEGAVPTAIVLIAMIAATLAWRPRNSSRA